MAKFYSGKEWLSNSQESRNPWSTSCTYIDVGSLGKVIYLAERTGQLPKRSNKGYPLLHDPVLLQNLKVTTPEHRKNIARVPGCIKCGMVHSCCCILQERKEGGQDEKRTKISPSIKLIEQIEILHNLLTELYKVKELIHHHHLEQETKDLTHPNILDEKTKKMEELSLHFSAIVDKKEELIKRLQQPFVGDYINIDADYQRYVVDVIPCLANVLSNLTTYMENLTWTTHFSLEDGKMEKILASVSTVLAQMQSYFQSLCTSRNLMSKILNDDVKETKK